MPKESFLKIIPEPKPKILPWLNVLFWFSMILLIGVVFSVIYLQKELSLLQVQEKNLKAQIAQLGTKEQQDLEAEIKKIANEIKDFGTLLRSHKITSNFFTLLKSDSHPKVYFSSLDLDAENNRINLSGRAENFRILGQQLLVFGENKDIQDLKVSNIKLSKEGKVEFGLSFTLSSEFFSSERTKNKE